MDVRNATQMSLLRGFVRESGTRGIDMQFCVGDGLGEPGQVAEFIANVQGVAHWCAANPALCEKKE